MRYQLTSFLATTTLLLSTPSQKEGLAPVQDLPPPTPETPQPLPDYTPSHPEEKEEHSPSYRLTLRNQEGNGVGYNQGYSSLDLFATPAQGWGSAFPFLDVRGHVFNNGCWAANGGLGVRWVPGSHVYGINVFYDYRHLGHHAYQQVGGGLEFLGKKWSARLNGYFPISERKHHEAAGFYKFEGHQAVFRRRTEFSFMGGDLEIEKKLYQNSWFGLDGLLKGYYFNGKFNKQAGGAMLGLNASLTSYLVLQGRISYDSFFHLKGNGELGLRIPLGSRRPLHRKGLSPSERMALEKRLIEPVERFEIIPIAHHMQQGPALDPNTGEPLYFVFVDNLRGSSDGSFENPYRTLAQAQSNSSSGNVIYVFPGDGTTSGMNQGIILQSGQRFLGSGTEHLFTTPFGVLPIAAQTSRSPTITAPTQGAVYCNNNTEVSGFNITGGAIGIRAIDVQNVLISRNVIANFTQVGIRLDDTRGALVRDNTIKDSTGNPIFGILTGASNSAQSDVILTGNTIANLNGTTIGITMATDGTSTFHMTATNNNISNCTVGMGTIEILDTSFLAVDVENNNISSCDLGVNIRLQDDSRADVSINRNYLLGNSEQGIFLRNGSTGSYQAVVSNNILILNGDATHAGMQVENTGMGFLNLSLSDNTCDTSPTAYQLTQSAGTFNLKTLSNNLGTFAQTGTITITD